MPARIPLATSDKYPVMFCLWCFSAMEKDRYDFSTMEDDAVRESWMRSPWQGQERECGCLFAECRIENEIQIADPECMDGESICMDGESIITHVPYCKFVPDDLYAVIMDQVAMVKRELMKCPECDGDGYTEIGGGILDLDPPERDYCLKCDRTGSVEADDETHLANCLWDSVGDRVYGWDNEYIGAIMDLLRDIRGLK